MGATLDGERVDRAVALLCGLPRAEVATLVGSGAVRLDGRAVLVRGRRVREGQLLTVDLPEVAAVRGCLEGDPSVSFDVVYEDRDLIVVDKPAGLVVHPGAGNPTGTLVQGLLARYPELAELTDGEGDDARRPGIVHRLDKGTSGLLIVARSRRARASLVADLAAHRVERTYLALVIGSVAADEGTVDAPLGRSLRDPTRISVTSGGREARTHYRVEARFAEPERSSLLECRLETGRTHQIRVHLAAIDHPVVGDGRYGGRRSSAVGALLPPDRPWLHARALAFAHPVSGRRIELSSPVPADLDAVLRSLS
ncbi:MAG: RluA family pseudouridine synthase [Actinomycetota bacterium]|nr:RluA family pseudouridine synthase [Actinomycetota bacterium]